MEDEKRKIQENWEIELKVTQLCKERWVGQDFKIGINKNGAAAAVSVSIAEVLINWCAEMQFFCRCIYVHQHSVKSVCRWVISYCWLSVGEVQLSSSLQFCCSWLLRVLPLVVICSREDILAMLSSCNVFPECIRSLVIHGLSFLRWRTTADEVLLIGTTSGFSAANDSRTHTASD